MKMNLYIFAGKKTAIDRLEKHLEKNDHCKVREFIYQYFPTNMFLVLNPKTIMEIGDILTSFGYEDDLDDYLSGLKANIKELKKNYIAKKNNASLEYDRVNRSYNSKYKTPTIDYSPQSISDLLSLMDARELYKSYIEGYEYERNVAYSWLYDAIDEALNHRTHETIKLVKSADEIGS